MAQENPFKIGQSVRDFQQWASLFSGRIFVKIIAYADESGHHDEEGELPGSQVTVTGGFAAKVESWIRFQKDWGNTLKGYSAPYFHYSEFASASAVARGRNPSSKHSENPYLGWPLERLDDFFITLAKIAASGSKLKMGGYVDTKRYAAYLKANPHHEITRPQEASIWMFYEAMLEQIFLKWPNPTWPISVFFDQTDDVWWSRAITKVHFAFRKKHARLRELTFADKKNHYALQAADMLVYRLRQVGAKFRGYDPRIPDSLPPFDRALFTESEVKTFADLYPS